MYIYIYNNNNNNKHASNMLINTGICGANGYVFCSIV